MFSLNIVFLGSPPSYSQQVGLALTKAGHQVTSPLHLQQPPIKSDLIIVAAHGAILSQSVIDAPKYGSLNLHPSLLPKYRGATPVPQTILHGDTQTGITIFKIDAGLDTGPILSTETVPVRKNDTSLDLLQRCFSLGSQLLIKILPDYIEGKLSPKPQPQNSPTPYCRKLTKKDGYLNWSQFSQALAQNFQSLDRKIRAYHPWPGVWTKMPNHKIVKILPQQQLQIEGKQPISIKQFLAGYSSQLN